MGTSIQDCSFKTEKDGRIQNSPFPLEARSVYQIEILGTAVTVWFRNRMVQTNHEVVKAGRLNLKRNVPEASKQPLTFHRDLATSEHLSQQTVSCHSEATPF